MAKLTKKDFERIGKMLANMKGVEGDVDAGWMRRQIILNLSWMFGEFNEKFDIEKFQTLAINENGKVFTADEV